MNPFERNRAERVRAVKEIFNQAGCDPRLFDHELLRRCLSANPERLRAAVNDGELVAHVEATARLALQLGQVSARTHAPQSHEKFRTYLPWVRSVAETMRQWQDELQAMPDAFQAMRAPTWLRATSNASSGKAGGEGEGGRVERIAPGGGGGGRVRPPGPRPSPQTPLTRFILHRVGTHVGERVPANARGVIESYAVKARDLEEAQAIVLANAWAKSPDQAGIVSRYNRELESWSERRPVNAKLYDPVDRRDDESASSAQDDIQLSIL